MAHLVFINYGSGMSLTGQPAQSVLRVRAPAANGWCAPSRLYLSQWHDFHDLAVAVRAFHLWNCSGEGMAFHFVSAHQAC